MIEMKRMNQSILALSVGLLLAGHVYAEDTPAATESNATASTDAASATPATSTAEASSSAASTTATTASATTTTDATKTENTPSLVKNAASSALQQKEGDANKKDNLEQVFTASERQYSLAKRGSYSGTYDLDYTYYRDTQLDLALDDSNSNITRLRIEDNATHSITNTFTVQYGLLNNLTLTAAVPLVAKSDVIKDTTTAGVGDISLGMRWEPFPLKQGRLPLILFGNVSTKTGDSPYEINATKDLATGKGYYSVGGGASTRKYIDPVVLFASVSANYGFKVSDLNQLRGTRTLTDFDPGISGGFAFGFAYSFNYDVSMTMSYQQSFNLATKYEFLNNSTGAYESSTPADQSSATFNISLGVRVSPTTIVNGSLGIGLTEDAPDVSLDLSFPLDFIGFGRQVR